MEAEAASSSRARAPYDDLPLRNVTAPVLIIHGLGDFFLLAACHNDVWQWVDGPVTLVTLPGAGHFIQQDAPDFVTRTIRDWMRGAASAPRKAPR